MVVLYQEVDGVMEQIEVPESLVPEEVQKELQKSGTKCWLVHINK